MTRIHIVVPSLKVCGGTLEAIRLGQDLHDYGCDVNMLSMWRSPHATNSGILPVIPLSSWFTRVARVPFQFPFIAIRFLLNARREKANASHARSYWVFTHFVTLPLALLVPRSQRVYFVQDLEWRFVRWPALVGLLQHFILFVYQRGTVITANNYLSQQLAMRGVKVAAEAPIWADGRYAVDSASARDIDVVMVLRKGVLKRLDLYRLFISQLRRRSLKIKLAVITPENEIAEMVGDEVDVCLLRPERAAMAAIYARSRLFLHLSEHEGFGLPPLEAMGAGCLPLCRDSGGVRAYMRGPLESLIVPLNSDIDAIIDRIQHLLADEPPRKGLATAAKAIFQEGLERARNRGLALAALLSPDQRTNDQGCSGAAAPPHP